MEIYLIRHAIAEDREDFEKTDKDDSLRPLTAKGRKKMQKTALKLHDLIGDVDAIVTSPYVRARQTAEILSQIFYETPVKEALELVPHAPALGFIRWMQAHGRDVQSLLVVGHEPHLSLLASYLLAGKNESFIELKKAGIACLEMGLAEEAGPASAHLKWLIPPKLWGDGS